MYRWMGQRHSSPGAGRGSCSLNPTRVGSPPPPAFFFPPRLALLFLPRQLAPDGKAPAARHGLPGCRVAAGWAPGDADVVAVSEDVRDKHGGLPQSAARKSRSSPLGALSGSVRRPDSCALLLSRMVPERKSRQSEDWTNLAGSLRLFRRRVPTDKPRRGEQSVPTRGR